MRLIRRERLERDLDRELGFHVDAETDRLVDEGIARDEARRHALASFGGLEPIREQARDARGTHWVVQFWQDLRYAVRVLRRSPGFGVAAIASLAIGIGANIALFTVADALLFRPLPVHRPEQPVTRTASRTPSFLAPGVSAFHVRPGREVHRRFVNGAYPTLDWWTDRVGDWSARHGRLVRRAGDSGCGGSGPDGRGHPRARRVRRHRPGSRLLAAPVCRRSGGHRDDRSSQQVADDDCRRRGARVHRSQRRQSGRSLVARHHAGRGALLHEFIRRKMRINASPGCRRTASPS